MGRPKNTIPDFWKHVDKSGHNGCWNWTGFIDRDGYGTYWWEGRPQGAHRLSYIFTHGSISPGQCVCHHCDNPPCVNPDHLWLGTHQDNIADKISKGRQAKNTKPNNPAKGERHGEAKLSDEQVHLIRNSLIPARVLAERFGVHPTRIYKIRQGKGWKHII